MLGHADFPLYAPVQELRKILEVGLPMLVNTPKSLME